VAARGDRAAARRVGARAEAPAPRAEAADRRAGASTPGACPRITAPTMTSAPRPRHPAIAQRAVACRAHATRTLSARRAVTVAASSRAVESPRVASAATMHARTTRRARRTDVCLPRVALYRRRGQHVRRGQLSGRRRPRGGRVLLALIRDRRVRRQYRGVLLPYADGPMPRRQRLRRGAGPVRLRVLDRDEPLAVRGRGVLWIAACLQP